MIFFSYPHALHPHCLHVRHLPSLWIEFDPQSSHSLASLLSPCLRANATYFNSLAYFSSIHFTFFSTNFFKQKNFREAVRNAFPNKEAMVGTALGSARLHGPEKNKYNLRCSLLINN